jgi:hypothetical protein
LLTRLDLFEAVADDVLATHAVVFHEVIVECLISVHQLAFVLWQQLEHGRVDGYVSFFLM